MAFWPSGLRRRVKDLSRLYPRSSGVGSNPTNVIHHVFYLFLNFTVSISILEIFHKLVLLFCLILFLDDSTHCLFGICVSPGEDMFYAYINSHHYDSLHHVRVDARAVVRIC